MAGFQILDPTSIDSKNDYTTTMSSSTIERWSDPYELPINVGILTNVGGSEYYFDRFGNKKMKKREKDAPTTTFKIDEDGFEWKLQDGYFWKRKALDRDQCRDETDIPEWIRDRKNPLPDVEENRAEEPAMDTASDFGIDEEAWYRMAESWYFDDFDKIVKFTFYNLGNRERGKKLVKEQFADVRPTRILSTCNFS